MGASTPASSRYSLLLMLLLCILPARSEVIVDSQQGKHLPILPETIIQPEDVIEPKPYVNAEALPDASSVNNSEEKTILTQNVVPEKIPSETLIRENKPIVIDRVIETDDYQTTLKDILIEPNNDSVKIEEKTANQNSNEILKEDKTANQNEEDTVDNSAPNYRYIGEDGDHKDIPDENPDGANHPCYRKCEAGKNMKCHYKFEIEWYHSLSKACYNCPLNTTDCERMDCIPGDGMSRPLTVINRKLPGPAVEVCVGDTVIVDVVNSLMSEGTTVHWHGHHQRGTPYMDGAPLVTQCAIPVGSSFRYTLTAAHAGTHFWHSHTGMQRADGALGTFIVREPQPKHQAIYDHDLSEHVMVLLDWTHDLGVSIFTYHHHSRGDNKPPSLLINGRGRFKQFNEGRAVYMPAARFNVEQGYRYRFRIVNAEFLNCPVEMSVDNHTITVISSDGRDFEPIEAVSLVTYAGERFDFIINADQEIDNYWIRFRGLMDCDARFTKAKQVAVLHYDGALEQEPPGEPSWEESHREGLQVNALNVGTGHNDTIAVPEFNSTDEDDESLRPQPDMQFYISYDFYAKNNFHYHKYPYYGINQVEDRANKLFTPQLNHISMKFQSFPLLPGRANIDTSQFCNESTVEGCDKDYCECTHVVNIPLKSVVEVVLVDEGFTFDANHPFHLHGYVFRVVSMQRVGKNITVDTVKELDAQGKIHRKLSKAPLKDTITVPDGGYTIIRWYADNPGYWLFHCHIEFHAEIGMALIFKVGEHEDFPPVPKGFPQCGNYAPSEDISRQKKSDSPSISFTQLWPLVQDGSPNASPNSVVHQPLLSAMALILLTVFRRMF